MNLGNIVIYLFLGLLGMSFIFIAMVIISFGYMKDEEKMMRKIIEWEESSS